MEPKLIEQMPGCVQVATKIVGNKWTPLIIRELASGTKRFGQLQRGLGGISPRTLSQRLDDLEDERIISRTVLAEVPPHVDYTLTPKGCDLIPILQQMADWGTKYHKQHS